MTTAFPATAAVVLPAWRKARGWPSLSGVALSLFLIAFLVDPGGGLGIKYASFVLAGGAMIATRLDARMPASFLAVEFPLFFVVPLALLWLSSAVFHVALVDSLSRVTPCLTWLMLPLLVEMSDEALETSFRRMMIVAAVLMIAGFLALYVLIAAGQIRTIIQVSLWMADKQMGYFGLRPDLIKQGLSVPSVYFRWAMLLVAGVIVCGPRRRGDMFLLGIASLLSLSTGVIAFGLGGLAAYLAARLGTTGRISRQAALLFVVVAVAVAVIAPYVLDVGAAVIDKFSGSNDSTSVKLGHIQSVLNEIAYQPTIILFGMGIGSEFFSLGANGFVNIIEVSQFDMIRQFGLPYFLAFTGYVAWLAVANWQRNAAGQRWSVALVMMYFAAGTNPLLYSPIYFLVMAFARARLVTRSPTLQLPRPQSA